MKVELRPTDSIRPYPGNPRDNDDAVAAVAQSIRQFGFRQPIVVDAEGVIVAGHTRWRAAQQLGLERVPVHVARDLAPEQRSIASYWGCLRLSSQARPSHPHIRFSAQFSTRKASSGLIRIQVHRRSECNGGSVRSSSGLPIGISGLRAVSTPPRAPLRCIECSREDRAIAHEVKATRSGIDAREPLTTPSAHHVSCPRRVLIYIARIGFTSMIQAASPRTGGTE